MREMNLYFGGMEIVAITLKSIMTHCETIDGALTRSSVGKKTI